jgi:hypothetical protein
MADLSDLSDFLGFIGVFDEARSNTSFWAAQSLVVDAVALHDQEANLPLDFCPRFYGHHRKEVVFGPQAGWSFRTTGRLEFSDHRPAGVFGPQAGWSLRTTGGLGLARMRAEG